MTDTLLHIYFLSSYQQAKILHLQVHENKTKPWDLKDNAFYLSQRHVPARNHISSIIKNNGSRKLNGRPLPWCKHLTTGTKKNKTKKKTVWILVAAQSSLQTTSDEAWVPFFLEVFDFIAVESPCHKEGQVNTSIKQNFICIDDHTKCETYLCLFPFLWTNYCLEKILRTHLKFLSLCHQNTLNLYKTLRIRFCLKTAEWWRVS